MPHKHHLSLDDCQVTTLAGGLRVASVPMASVRTVSVGVWIHAGSRLETTQDSGVAHFLEHMSFKGTQRRTAHQIAEEIELVGGHSNAYTSKEQTAYYIKLLAEDLPLAVDILSDILLHSTFQQDELERERGVILQEMAMYEDQPDDMAFEAFQNLAFPEQPLGRPIIGTQQVVASMSAEQLRGYIERHYSADRTVIVAAGKVDHDSFVALVAEKFDTLKAFDTPAISPAHYLGGQIKRHSTCEQMHSVLGWPSCSYQDLSDHYASIAVASIAGGGMSSRLFQQVREQHGLAYSVFAFHSPYQDCGIFGLYAATAPEKAEQAIAISRQILHDMCSNITALELRKVQAQMKSSLLMGLESSSSRAETTARQLLLHDRLISTQERIERIDNLDRQYLQQWLEKILSRPESLTFYGNTEKLSSTTADTDATPAVI